MSYDCMLTTIDNPFDPFEQFASWFQFDNDKGYNSCGRLMRIAKIAEDMTEDEYDSEIERAIDALIEDDFMNIYKKVTRNTSKTD